MLRLRLSRDLSLLSRSSISSYTALTPFSTSSSSHDIPFAPNDPSSLPPLKETIEVNRMSALLTRIRDTTDPEYRSLNPMRSPKLWTETLATLRQATAPISVAKNLPRSAETVFNSESPAAKRMHESYCQVDLPFRSNPLLLEKYTNASGGIRTGKLMEHLDSIAGSVAYKHVLQAGQTIDDIGNTGFYVVTAAADRLDMLKPLTSKNVTDLRLSGQVVYVGKSSMEVVVKMECLEANGKEETIMLGRFTMVCRDAKTHQARHVPPLVLVTSDERAMHAMGEAHKLRKQSEKLSSLARTAPCSIEAELLHDVYLQYGEGSAIKNSHASDGIERVWMKDTKLESVTMMYPQDRNIQSKIFGGYLMRLAYELGYTNASLFTRSQLRFLSLDGIHFKLPVPIGSALHLTSTITHTASDDHFNALVHVWVQANVIDSHSGEEKTTNDFYLTWCQDRNIGEPLKRMVVPQTYQDAMHWLEAKRALSIGADIRGLRKSS